MFDLSFGKLLLLAVIALVVLGPDKLPKAARMAGAMLRRLRTGWDSVRAEVEREVQVEEIRRAAREAVAHAESAKATTTDTLRKVREAVSDVGRDPTESPDGTAPKEPRHGDT